MKKQEMKKPKKAPKAPKKHADIAQDKALIKKMMKQKGK